jgi:hypothetical protein
MRLVKVDGKNAVAYILGKHLVIATGDAVVSKEGNHGDLAALAAEHTNLKSHGFSEVKP